MVSPLASRRSPRRRPYTAPTSGVTQPVRGRRRLTAMSDDSLLWTHRPAPRCRPRPGEPLWSVRRDGVTWSAELRYHGEYGVEAQILRNGELRMGRRFPLKEQAIRWAEEEKAHAGERTEFSEWADFDPF